MYRLCYTTATGDHYTPWHADVNLLRAWITFLGRSTALVHRLEARD